MDSCVEKSSDDKIQIRKEIRKKLKLISGENKILKSSKVSQNLARLVDSLKSENFFMIGGFAPMKNEVSWHSEFVNMKMQFSFPFPLSKTTMEFKVSRYEDLTPSKEFGPEILVPRPESETVVPDLIIIPGIAFTLKGDRLGQGGGYYDRYLENFKGIKIGICFEEQVLPEVPVGEFDVKMDYITYESGFESCSCA